MPSPATHRARALRKSMTLAERRLWARLRRFGTGARFRRQAPIGPWIAPFLSHSAQLVVEIGAGRDAAGPLAAARAEDLARRGFRVLRFAEAEVLADADAVARAIAEALPPPACPASASLRSERRASLPRGTGEGRGGGLCAPSSAAAIA